jgi:hypothetical protein
MALRLMPGADAAGDGSFGGFGKKSLKVRCDRAETFFAGRSPVRYGRSG